MLCINDLIDYAICNIAINANDASFYFKCDEVSDLWQHQALMSEFESELRYTKNWRRNRLVDFYNSFTIDFKMDCLLKKAHFLICWDCLSPQNWIKPFLFSVCSCHVTYAFQSEFTLYSCLNVKALLARSRREIWSFSYCNWTRTHNHLTTLAKWLSVRSQTKWLWVRVTVTPLLPLMLKPLFRNLEA